MTKMSQQTKRITLDLEKSLHRSLKVAAVEEGVPVAVLLREAIGRIVQNPSGVDPRPSVEAEDYFRAGFVDLIRRGYEAGYLCAPLRADSEGGDEVLIDGTWHAVRRIRG